MMSDRTVWYVVADLTRPCDEPFAVLRVDTSVRSESGVEGEVISLHRHRDDAEDIAGRLNDGLPQSRPYS